MGVEEADEDEVAEFEGVCMTRSNSTIESKAQAITATTMTSALHDLHA
jgi:hypothetical protein